MRRPPNFLPRRFFMRLKKNSRNATSSAGKYGTKSPIAPPTSATTSSNALKNDGETPVEGVLDEGRSMTLSNATRLAITAPTPSHGIESIYIHSPSADAYSTAPEMALNGTAT